MDLVKSFRTLAMLEATSFLALLVASMFKHGLDMETGVAILGPIHGALFVGYIVLALIVRQTLKWSALATIGVLLGAVIPFGGFVVDKWMSRPTLAR